MPLRMMEIIVPSTGMETVLDVLDKQETMGIWRETLDDDHTLIRVLLQGEKTEAISDRISERVSTADGLRIMLFAVEATVPHPEEPSAQQQEPSAQAQATEEEDEASHPERISREELYTDIADGARLSRTYVASAILAAVVAAIGLMYGSVTVIIGAMVIAPLLGPNIALALAATLGDVGLALRALKASAVAFVCIMLVSLAIGFFFGINPKVPEIATRTQVSAGNVVLALAAGSAGALVFSTGVPTALIGVMVAVALLPPLVASGLLAGAGHGTLALGAMLLFLSNVAGVNLAAMVTFVLQGIRPRTWWETEKAKRATRIALVFWVVLLGVFVAIVFVLRK